MTYNPSHQQRPPKLRIHAICLALNEQITISHVLQALYPFCSGISVLSQYDRDWYGRVVEPDATVPLVLNYPDPEGKIHLVVRRWRDQAAAFNSELGALSNRPARRIQSHGTPIEQVRAFHNPPDYFLIVDADEIYDMDTMPRILEYLARKRPRGMRMVGHNYVRDWNHRVPRSVADFTQFGFVVPGIHFVHARTVTWNVSRLSKALNILHLPDLSDSAFGFITCPEDVGHFHHGCWIGSRERLAEKGLKSVHHYNRTGDYAETVCNLAGDYVPTEALPRNLRDGDWPAGYLER